MSPVTIIIAGVAVAKGRPRMTRKGFAYTPAATRKYEAHGRLAAREATAEPAPIAVPVRAEITVDLPLPGSWSRKRQAAALADYIRPTSRPDTNNYVKAELDGIAIVDDSRRTRRGEEIRARPEAHDHVHATVGDSKWRAAA